MKKRILIPVVMIASSLSFFSCSNAGEGKAEMKAPVENQEKEAGEKAAVNPVNKEEAKTKTIANMQSAFKGETTASAKYAAYSKKAEQEGLNEIALLFKAASASENVHANNHKAVLQEMGITTPVIKPEFTVKSTKENLVDAIEGETYEVTTMYPEFITMANEAENQLALISLNYAYKTEKKHKLFYENALAALNSNTVKSMPAVYYLCPTCGNTYETKAPARCGISMTDGDKFIKINSL
jgi:rubrerythrin